MDFSSGRNLDVGILPGAEDSLLYWFLIQMAKSRRDCRKGKHFILAYPRHIFCGGNDKLGSQSWSETSVAVSVGAMARSEDSSRQHRPLYQSEL
jgi:hypothetical protein